MTQLPKDSSSSSSSSVYGSVVGYRFLPVQRDRFAGCDLRPGDAPVSVQAGGRWRPL